MNHDWITELIIHCDDTKNGRTTTPRELDLWHAERICKKELTGRKEETLLAFNPHLPYVGYHSLIQPSGQVHPLRGENELGSHCAGHNGKALGVVLAGRDSYTLLAWTSLKEYVLDVCRRYSNVSVHGHREFNSGKTCPGFDVKAWLENEMKPLEGHILHAPSNEGAPNAL